MRNRNLVLGLTAFLALALAVPALGGPSNPVASSAVSLKKVKKKANAALAAAAAAQATADQAKTAASGAQTTANTANTNANQAKTAAAAAQASADAAQLSADAANANANTRLKTTDFVQGTVSAATSSDKTAPLDAACATGDFLTGGGYILGGTGANDVTATTNAPYVSLWLVAGKEIGAGTADTWTVQAWAMCAST